MFFREPEAQVLCHIRRRHKTGGNGEIQTLPGEGTAAPDDLKEAEIGICVWAHLAQIRHTQKRAQK